MKINTPAKAVPCLLLAVGILSATLPLQAQTVTPVRLTSLDWPPYAAPYLAHQGVSTVVVSAAMAAMGYRAEVDFFPWKRATALVRGNSRYIAYFPEYRSTDVAATCLMSDPIGGGPLGFAERIDAPITWSNLDDLARFQVGVVAGYVNSDAFDEQVHQGRQRVNYAVSDKQNLIKLAAKRFPLALIDRRVFEYLTRHDSQVAALAPRLHFNRQLLESKNLYVCFRRSAEGERLRKVFNRGLKKVNVQGLIDAAMGEMTGTP